MTTRKQQFDDQQFANEYPLVNGVFMHTENPKNFHVPPEVIKQRVRPGQFVELRIDSLMPRSAITSAFASNELTKTTSVKRIPCFFKFATALSLSL